MRSTCSVEGCSKPSHARTWCDKHYARWWLRGDDPAKSRYAERNAPLIERLMARTLVSDDCWEWVGGKTNHGYGSIFWQGKNLKAHRVWYEELVGPIPAGLFLDHLCENKSCVNPWHLEPVTQAENNRRGSHCPTCACRDAT